MSCAELLSSFQGQKALVVGDLMLDEYIFGQATRISPEAPVMVVRQRSTRSVPGGAANVAANLTALGAKTEIVGVVGADPYGDSLALMLGEQGLVRDASRPTTRKTRVLGNHSHQVLRIDHEEDHPVEAGIERQLLDKAFERIASMDVVLVSDYQKGGVTSAMIRELVAFCRDRSVPVVANPKPRSLVNYRGAALVSLNRFEAGAALGSGQVEDADAETAAASLRTRYEVENLLVTLGGSGMAAATSEGSFRVPAVKAEVYDEAGAGDTVIATVALGISVGRFGPSLLGLAAHTSAAVVQKVGVAVPTREDLDRITAL
ncbi:MAG TPA: PfkB family carbohydrate kinase [Fimbriimonas sp.]